MSKLIEKKINNYLKTELPIDNIAEDLDTLLADLSKIVTIRRYYLSANMGDSSDWKLIIVDNDSKEIEINYNNSLPENICVETL